MPHRHGQNTQRAQHHPPQQQPMEPATPVIQTVKLKNNYNRLPETLFYKLQNAEFQHENEQNHNNKNPKEKPQKRPKPMIKVGHCWGFLFGFVNMANSAQCGEVRIKFRSQWNKKSNQRETILSVHNLNDDYLGEADKRLVVLFGDFCKNEKVRLRAKIIEANLDKLKRSLPPNKYVKKLDICVYAQHDCILSMVQISKKKVKKWQWYKKEAILKYFEGEEVEFNALNEDIEDAILECSEANKSFNGGIEALEANFNAAFANDITADDLEGIDPFTDIVETKLLQHQRVGIEWMSLRENFTEDQDDELPPFYREIEDKETGDIKYINIISEEEIEDLPELGAGGILADDMGLGKTLQCISLIASNSGYQDGEKKGPTLIIAPLTVLGNWTQQIKDHCAENSLKVMEYHGPRREKDLDIIKSHDVVVTTFDIVALEYSNETDENREEMRKHYGCGLQYVDWLRVVLDEAHKIRSRKTRAFKACNALQSKSRWCLSGTPVQNRLDDLYSLFCFLKLQPICDKSFWNKFIVQPLKSGDEIGFERLRKVMKQMCLRRDKSMKIGGKPIISIPPKKLNRRLIQFNSSDKMKYQQLMAIHKRNFAELRKSGDSNVMKNFSSVLSMLLRLRQCCAHTMLVPELNQTSSLANMTLDDIKKSVGSLDFMSDANQECASCGMNPDSSILTTCNHLYCKDCFLYEIEVNSGSFPCVLCGEKMTKKSIVQQKESSLEAEEDENKQNEDGDESEKKPKKKYEKFVVPEGKIEPSTKMQALIDDVKKWSGVEVGGRPNKAVVFSQWTSVLDILGRCLEQEEIRYERLDGSMQRAAREDAMNNFRMDDSIPIFLMSLKAGNLGVNMTTANHVYMLDPWWNPATEDQAVDRVYRLGQKRVVTINHFCIKDSVEEKILQIQERKRKLIASALGQSKSERKNDRKKEWLNDLKDLFASK